MHTQRVKDWWESLKRRMILRWVRRGDEKEPGTENLKVPEAML